MASKDYPSAEPFLPEKRDHGSLAKAAADCQGCPLYKDAEHVVFGEGPTDARLMLVGESPGRNEDEQGRPFVGDAGRVLDRALEDAGLSRDEVVSYHPSAALRHPVREERDRIFDALVEDLRMAQRPSEGPQPEIRA